MKIKKIHKTLIIPSFTVPDLTRIFDLAKINESLTVRIVIMELLKYFSEKKLISKCKTSHILHKILNKFPYKSFNV
jgi:hypothetical protein